MSVGVVDFAFKCFFNFFLLTKKDFNLADKIFFDHFGLRIWISRNYWFLIVDKFHLIYWD